MAAISQTKLSKHFRDKIMVYLNSSDAADAQMPALRVNTMPVDALATKVARTSAGIVLTVWDKKHLYLLQI